MADSPPDGGIRERDDLAQVGKPDKAGYGQCAVGGKLISLSVGNLGRFAGACRGGHVGSLRGLVLRSGLYPAVGIEPG